jgi:putative membrane protein
MKTAPFVSSLVAVAIAACGGEHRANSPRPLATATQVTAVPPADLRDAEAAPLGAKEPGATSNMDPQPLNTPPPPTAAPPPTAVDAGGPQQAPQALSDEEILQIIHVAHLGETEQGVLAQQKGKDIRVRRLGVMIVKDHVEADSKGRTLAKKRGLDLAPTPLSTALQSDLQDATSTLRTKSGSEFDQAYVDVQVKEHQALLDLIDDKLAPAAKSTHVKEYLSDLRPKIARHLQHAQDLQAQMAQAKK